MQQAIERIARVLASDPIAYDEIQGLLADAITLPPGELDTLIARADAVHRLLIGARLQQENVRNEASGRRALHGAQGDGIMPATTHIRVREQPQRWQVAPGRRPRMVIDIEVTRRPDGRFVARALHIPGVIVEATSREDVLAQMRETLVARQTAGVEIVQLDLGDVAGLAETPWPPLSGAFPDDEVYREMLAEVERYRRELDQDAAA